MNEARPKIRLHVTEPLKSGSSVTLSKDQSHYVVRVMRQQEGARALLFNGKDGEWLAEITSPSKSGCVLALREQTRQQGDDSPLTLAFAPIKKSRLDFLIEKATELGVGTLLPVLTQHTENTRVNVERLQATVTEASEQCERLSVPTVLAPIGLEDWLNSGFENKILYMLDETGEGVPVKDAFSQENTDKLEPILLVGPEGGFSRSELDLLHNLPFVKAVSLGPRVLRAETAAITALGNWQAFAGDGCVIRKR